LLPFAFLLRNEAFVNMTVQLTMAMTVSRQITAQPSA